MQSCDIPGLALKNRDQPFPDPEKDIPPEESADVAVLAGGCFWCVEAVYRELDGVLDVTSGYAGGTADTADYRSVSTGRTGHAEAVQLRFDPHRISYGQLLKIFFSVAHDPTQRNRQGNDTGPQYRSALFPVDEAQQAIARAYIAQLERAGVFREAIATTLEAGQHFHPAEAYHQDYAQRNPDQPYIRLVSRPKVEKLRSVYADKLKKE